jgi:type IV pilus assembly protein PilA
MLTSHPPKSQLAYTLIELLIVLAIIGILASIAISNYLNYVARTQLAEGVILLNGYKTPIISAVSDGGFSNCVSTYSYLSSLTSAGTYVQSISLSNANATNCKALASFFSSTLVSSYTLSLTYTQSSTGAPIWTCFGNMPSSLLPQSCVYNATP